MIKEDQVYVKVYEAVLYILYLEHYLRLKADSWKSFNEPVTFVENFLRTTIITPKVTSKFNQRERPLPKINITSLQPGSKIEACKKTSWNGTVLVVQEMWVSAWKATAE